MASSASIRGEKAEILAKPINQLFKNYFQISPQHSSMRSAVALSHLQNAGSSKNLAD
jgi:hypothetical protein